MIHRIPGGEDDGRIIQQVDSLLPEFPGGDPVDLDELPETDIQVEFFNQFPVRRFVKIGWLRLTNEYIFDLQRMTRFYPTISTGSGSVRNNGG
jgi:hypothetical protein